MKLFTDRLREVKVTPIEAGERLSYSGSWSHNLSNKNKDKDYLGDKMMLTSTYLKLDPDGPDNPKIDYYLLRISKIFRVSRWIQALSSFGLNETNYLLSNNDKEIDDQENTTMAILLQVQRTCWWYRCSLFVCTERRIDSGWDLVE